MKLAVDCSVLANPHTGIGVYTREILKHFMAYEENLEIKSFMATHWSDEPLRLNGDGMGASRLSGQVKDVIKRLPGSRYLWNQHKKHRFEQGAKELGADVFWEPCFIAPGHISPMVPTIHDLSHVRYPQYHPKSRVQWMNGLAQTLERSAKVITVSNFSKQEIVDIYGLSPEKIEVVYNGVGGEYGGVDVEARRPVLEKYGIKDQQYFLSVATLEPRKNLETLLRAYNLLPKDIQKDVPLVLVGAAGWGKEGKNSFYEELCPNGNLIFTGFIPSQDLPALYAGAYAFAYPAIYEGFGIPLVEAMASGTPVLTSKIPVSQEVCETAAIYAEPRDHEAWSDILMKTLSQSKSDREMQIQNGKERAKFFSWDKSARETYDVLKSVAG